MKDFRKILTLFIIIFIVGIFLIYSTVKSSLKNNPTNNIETVQKDTTILIESEKVSI